MYYLRIQGRAIFWFIPIYVTLIIIVYLIFKEIIDFQILFYLGDGWADAIKRYFNYSNDKRSLYEIINSNF